MNSTRSIWNLYVRSSVYKLLTILLVLTAVDCAAFFSKAAGAEYLAQAFPETLWKAGFILAFLALTAVLVFPGWKGGRSDYTLDRLGLSRRDKYRTRALFHALCLFMLIAAQTLVLVLLCAGFEKAHQNAYSGPQNIPLLFYRSEFLHALLPLADLSRLVRNFVMIAAFGVVTAAPENEALQGRARIKKQGMVIAYTVFFAACFGAVPMMNLPMDLVFACIALLAAVIQLVLAHKGEEHADESRA